MFGSIEDTTQYLMLGDKQNDQRETDRDNEEVEYTTLLCICENFLRSI